MPTLGVDAKSAEEKRQYAFLNGGLFFKARRRHRYGKGAGWLRRPAIFKSGKAKAQA
jgi:hypothetical protein